MNHDTDSKVVIHKHSGETPLEALERFRRHKIDSCADKKDIDQARYWKEIPLTYAGRLDPLAEGKLIILIGDECKNKDKYLGYDKEYEVEVLFGFETDTYDVLGMVNKDTLEINLNSGNFTTLKDIDIQKYKKRYIQEYPLYSSKKVEGKQLHTWGREGNIPDNIPNKEVEIYSISEYKPRVKIPISILYERIIHDIDRVKGDFRQDEIKARWKEVCDIYAKNGVIEHEIWFIRVSCSSGTYMRSLAHIMGKERGIGACALHINRTGMSKK